MWEFGTPERNRTLAYNVRSVAAGNPPAEVYYLVPPLGVSAQTLPIKSRIRLDVTPKRHSCLVVLSGLAPEPGANLALYSL